MVENHQRIQTNAPTWLAWLFVRRPVCGSCCCSRLDVSFVPGSVCCYSVKSPRRKERSLQPRHLQTGSEVKRRCGKGGANLSGAVNECGGGEGVFECGCTHTHTLIWACTHMANKKLPERQTSCCFFCVTFCARVESNNIQPDVIITSVWNCLHGRKGGGRYTPNAFMRACLCYHVK